MPIASPRGRIAVPSLAAFVAVLAGVVAPRAGGAQPSVAASPTNHAVMTWLHEAPLSDAFGSRSAQPFSYPDWFARGRALPRAAATLALLLEHEDPARPTDDGRHAAYALGWIGRRGDPRAVGALLRSLHSQDVGLRMEAAAALGRLGDAAVLPVLVGLLANTGEDVNVRANACMGLGFLGLAAGEPAIRGALGDPSAFIVRVAQEALRVLHAPHAP